MAENDTIKQKVETLLDKVALGDEEAKTELAKLAETLNAQRIHNGEKATKLETDLNAALEKLNKPQENGGKPAEGEKPPVVEEPKISVEEFVELQAGGYSSTQVKDIFALAKTLKVSPADVLKNETLKAGLEAQWAKATATAATPAPTGQVITLGEKPVTDLSKTEVKGNFASLVDKAVKKGRAGK